MTDIIRNPFTLSEEENKLTYEFMREFSRFEFALKMAGHAEQRGTKLVVPWWEFIDQNDVSYETPPAEVIYLVDKPPQRQVKTSNSFGWQPINPPPTPVTLKWLLTAAYTVRNNLFHGGKWTDRKEVARDKDLIRAARHVVSMCLAVNPTVLAHYENPL